jgi:rRNA-processing protein Efg1
MLGHPEQSTSGARQAMDRKKNKDGRKGKKQQFRRNQQHQNGPPRESLPADNASVNALKAQLRNLSRLLSKCELAADVRQDTERQVAAMREKLVATLVKKERKGVLKKYHMVRFFERQKATRIVKRLKKTIEPIDALEDSEAHRRPLEQLKERLHIAETDLFYTTHAPLEDIYVSLYPQGSKVDGSKPEASQPEARQTAQQARATKPPLWSLIERAMGDGSIEDVRLGIHPALDELGLGERVAMRKKMAELEGRFRVFGVADDAKERENWEEKKKRAKGMGMDGDRMDDGDGDGEDGGFFERV